MWRSTFFPPTIFRRYMRLKQMNRTCLAIQTHPDELNWARRRTFHELNSLTLVRRMWRLTFVSETIFTRSIRLKQTDRTCWTIQTHADKLNWARRRTFHELNSLGSSREKFDVWTRPEFFKFHTVSARNSFDFRSAITLERADKLLYIYWHLCVSKPHSMP